MTQTRTMPLMNGTLSATVAGTRKIPEPITEPTTTQNASTGPSTRGKVTFWRSAISPRAIESFPDEVMGVVDFPRSLCPANGARERRQRFLRAARVSCGPIRGPRSPS